MERRPDSNIGATLAGYRLERLLGRGGMGLVYLAEDLRLGRKVALKLLAPELAEDERFRERFLRESKLAASLDHPSVVPIFEAGEADGQLYLAMRYVDGTDLRSVLAEEGRLEPTRALAILAQVASALDAAHERGLVHRDVKPANVLLAGEHAYLADFGLTKRASSHSGLTETGHLAGTVDYIAPEQIRGEAVDGRADVYALGCMVHECLAGDPPFARDNEVATLWGHIQEPPPSTRAARPELPDAIDAVVARALAKAPAERYATCTELVRAADAVLAPAPATLAARPSRDRWVILGLAGVLAAAAAVGALLLLPDDETVPVRALPHSLGAIDPEANELVGVAKVGLVPKAALEVGGTVYVANATEHTVSRVDAAALEADAPAGLTGAPVALAVAPDGVYAVTTHQPQSLVTVSPPGSEQPTLGTTVLTDAPVPNQIFVSDLAEAAGDLWISVPEDEAGHDVVRVSRGAVEKRIDSVPAAHDFDDSPTIVGLAAGGGAVWVVTGGGSVIRIDPRTNGARLVSALDASASSIAFGAGSVWVADGVDDLLFRLNPDNGRVDRTLEVGQNPTAVEVGHGAVWVANGYAGTVSKVDPATNLVVATIPIGGRPESLHVGADRVWVTVSAQSAVVS